jgi:hypothetical protein
LKKFDKEFRGGWWVLTTSPDIFFHAKLAEIPIRHPSLIRKNQKGPAPSTEQIEFFSRSPFPAVNYNLSP